MESIYDKIIRLWNEQADQFNQWENLSEEEKIEFSYNEGIVAALKARNEVAESMLQADSEGCGVLPPPWGCVFDK